MDFGLDVAQHQLTWDDLLERVRFAEDAGFTGVWLFDHFKALYGDPTGPCLEAWSLLAALGVATERIRLGTLVTGITYRHPSMLAMQAVTVDHVSQGRLELAVGAAWHESEHHELGFDFPPPGERVDRLAEAIEVMRLLMTTDGAHFDGEHHRLVDATFRPRPVQQPHPPIWIGASGQQRMIPLAARVADVWHTLGSPADLERKSRTLDEAAEQAGRDPAEIRRATNLSLSEPIDEIRRTAEQCAELGFNYLIASWPEQGVGRVEEFVSEVMQPLS
jgi:F420-dependent oxidoreductase-like protein